MRSPGIGVLLGAPIPVPPGGRTGRQPVGAPRRIALATSAKASV
jgi:hypothetical protein